MVKRMVTLRDFSHFPSNLVPLFGGWSFISRPLKKAVKGTKHMKSSFVHPDASPFCHGLLDGKRQEYSYEAEFDAWTFSIRGFFIGRSLIYAM